MNNKGNTYCSYLWDSLTIDKFGDVYNCCLLKPQKLGSIFSNSVQELLDSNIGIMLRKKSLEGKLSCYKNCNLVNKNLFSKSRILKVRENDLNILHISCSEKCNIKCIMCGHPLSHKEKSVELPAEILIKKINFTNYNTIILQGGEPLFIESCLEVMDFLFDNKIKFTLLTNGLLIDDTIADKLAKNSCTVSISINGATEETHNLINHGSDFNKVLKNINLLIEKRKFYNSNLIIYGRMTLVEQNLLEIPQFIEHFEDLGFDKINFGYDNPSVPNYLNNNTKITRNLTKSIKYSLKNANINNIDLKRLDYLGLR